MMNIPFFPPKGCNPTIEGDYLKGNNLKAHKTQAESPDESDVQVRGSIGEMILPVFG